MTDTHTVVTLDGEPAYPLTVMRTCDADRRETSDRVRNIAAMLRIVEVES